ncbi:thioredoxin-disulfide reductase [Prochlorococcus sp. MIT 1307]|uniref:thioredoxin-disulfide reductase n=1 Tax=Prochlorococcus sp. MIT 1307 TaxID=3096219 RepID=UPI002A7477EE|nr:thioredoxin-disulfide reductase [Prochlorococcus sp. MIT 1307]
MTDKKSSNVENLVIIGSGPAGYTAAIYAARANLKPLLITGFQAGGIPGGQLMTTTFVENFPGFPDGILGPDLMDLLKAQAVRWGTQLIEADAKSIALNQRPFLVSTAQREIQTHSLVIATGAKANRLGLPNEETFWSRGISACAICDGATPQFNKEELAVVGGGDSACEEAVYLTKFGSHVHLIVRSNKLKASASLTNKVFKSPLITIHWETQLIDVNGDDWLDALLIKKKEASEIKRLPVRGLFYAIGHTPNTEIFQTQLLIDDHGYIKTKPGRPETSVDGVFAAGDVADSEWRQGITAAGSGCKAALAAERWLTKNNLSKLCERESLEPAKATVPKYAATTTELDFQSNAIWQKGSYALRKLYHESKSPLIVIYTSPNCGPCHVIKPQLKKALEELKGKAQCVEIDIELEQQIAQQAGVNGTPTVQLFKDKALISSWRGVKQHSIFKEAIIRVLEE